MHGKRQPCRRCGGPKEPGERRHYCDACKPLAAEERRQAKNAGNRDWYYANRETIAERWRVRQRTDPEFARAAYERAKAWAEANPERWAEHRRKHVTSYRAKQRDNFIEAVSHREVYDRDGGICYLCGEPIPLDVDWRDGLAFQVDHVVPVTRDGEHSYANVRATHRKCNRRKGARLLDP
jgi:5-methylcytosine-specific restriction endonuclease McrA